jgi:hypothetical protein
LGLGFDIPWLFCVLFLLDLKLEAFLPFRSKFTESSLEPDPEAQDAGTFTPDREGDTTKFWRFCRERCATDQPKSSLVAVDHQSKRRVAGKSLDEDIRHCLQQENKLQLHNAK